MANIPFSAVISVSGTVNQIASSGGLYPIISIVNDPVLPGSGSVGLPSGNTAARAGIPGSIRFNSQTNVFEGTIDGVTWFTFEMGAGGVLAVPGGGTGATSFTPYAVITGGTTSTGPLQNVVGVGALGQILTSNGAGTLPSWQANSGGSGSSVLLASQTASNSATLDFNAVFSSSYDMYTIELFGIIPSVTNRRFWMRFGTGAGPTFQTTGYSWTSMTVRSDLGTNANFNTFSLSNTSEIVLSLVDAGGSGPSSSGTGVFGTITLVGPNGAANAIGGSYSNVLIEDTSNVMCTATGGIYMVSNTYTSIRFLFDSGNIASGTIRVYGIKNS